MKAPSQLVALICALGVGCQHGAGGQDYFTVEARAKSLCEVMADPKPHVGQRITVKGKYFGEPHQRLIYDDSCSDAHLPVRYSLHTDGDAQAESIVERARIKDSRVRVPVVYSGILTARSIIHGCTRPSCLEYRLEESQLLAAAPQGALPPRQ